MVTEGTILILKALGAAWPLIGWWRKRRGRRMAESALVRKIVRKVRERYPQAYVRKLSDRFVRGLPDLLVIFPAPLRGHTVVLLVECKMPKSGRLSPAQRAEHKAADRAGLFHRVVVVARDAETVLKEMETRGAVGCLTWTRGRGRSPAAGFPSAAGAGRCAWTESPDSAARAAPTSAGLANGDETWAE
jgi:hypothetical protein